MKDKRKKWWMMSHKAKTIKDYLLSFNNIFKNECYKTYSISAVVLVVSPVQLICY